MWWNRKISIGKGDDYTAGCLTDFSYFIKKYRLIAVDLSKQKPLDVDSRAIQQIVFIAAADVLIYCNCRCIDLLYSWKIERNYVRICKRNNKSFVINIDGWM